MTSAQRPDYYFKAESEDGEKFIIEAYREVRDGNLGSLTLRTTDGQPVKSLPDDRWEIVESGKHLHRTSDRLPTNPTLESDA